jgi:hypothetical protein
MGKVIDFGRGRPHGPPTLAVLVERVHELSLNTENVLWDHPHIRERLALRDKTMREVLEVLRRGKGVKGPDLDKYGDYRVRLAHSAFGRRTQVVVAVQATSVTVVTVF